MKRSHFLKILGIGAATPLLLKAGGISLEKKYIPLGPMVIYRLTHVDYSSPLLHPFSRKDLPIYTTPGNWIITDAATGEKFDSVGDNVIAVDDSRGVVITEHWGINERGSIFTQTLHRLESGIKMVYSPGEFDVERRRRAIERYKDYLDPKWRPTPELRFDMLHLYSAFSFNIRELC